MSVVDDIKARLDIVSVISHYVPSLKKTGRNYKALCPFHAEKTPSFVVDPTRQIWRCFGGCNEGGDIFSFIMKIEGYDFREALRVLAEQAGVQLEEQTPESKAYRDHLEQLQLLLDEAAQLYHEYLCNAAEAETARQYVMQKRGLLPETIEQFQIGYAPNSWSFVLDHFRTLGYSLSDLSEAGLISENEQGRYYDRFRHRLMIPIRNARGHTIGFGARALDSDQNPKYLNSPQGPLFDKSKNLFGFDLARRAIRETETAVIVEGYLDVIQAHQAGYHNVVAQMGTALTETQVQLLAKYANRLILALDTDAAGQQATMRGLSVMQESLTGAFSQVVPLFDAKNMMRTGGRLSLDIRVLRLPEGKDPDDFIRAHPELWAEQVEQAQPLAQYVIDIGTQDLPSNATIQERENVARQLLPLLVATENDLTKRYNVQLLATRLRIPEADLLSLASALQQHQQRGTSIKTIVKPKKTTPTNNGHSSTSGIGTERYVIARLLEHPDWLFVVNRKLRELAQEHEGLREFLTPIHTQDFSQEVYRVLYRLIEAASYAGESSPMNYIYSEAPYEISSLAETILQETQPQGFRKSSSTVHWSTAEMVSILRAQDSSLYDESEILRDFVIRTLTLRLERIKNERNDRYFFLSTDYGILSNEDMALVSLYTQAQKLLEQTIRNLTQRQDNQRL
ncbi:MAG: DNA primase [Phototrophicales bacterium]|nr:MAG: DNA primase [Phototrophicales bacterium]